ncbi:amidohydrolase family protein [Granulicella tundricola]|uniref:amidohydrolase family protein n=1 Tax=Granulicella tundricola TaxID=940615 RepID=UPI0012F7E126|nr:amidohydrolase family protein [Granulicella tundricola]
MACSRRGLVWVVAVLAGVGGVAAGQRVTAPVPAAVTRDLDPGLMKVIDGARAVDNHAHPVLPPPNDKTDREFDALPVDNMEAETDTVAWRTDNPQLPEAWKALWGFDGKVPLDEAGMKGLNAARERVKAAKGTGYAAWVLDEAGVGTMLGNRVAMGPGVMRPRFEWVPYADALLLPLDTSRLAKGSPDKALFYPMEDTLRGKYLKALGMGAVPGTLSEYLAKVVTPTLERQRAGGAVAEKFEVAYLRGFDFTVVTRERAAALYAKGALSAGEYKELQDFLFRYIALECGRLGMAVHLHVMAGGGGYFGVAGADPLLLEPLFNDSALRKTKFVMLHGGWPFVREAGALLQKPNVYLDLSQEALTFSPRTLSGWLREWLETYPEKVMYGTDGYPLSDAMGWEEATWIADRNVRLALGLALTGMLRDGEVTRERAEGIATEVLRGTAAGVYGLR